jgi:hypothetical protein
MRGREYSAIRDSVLFEFALFIGRLGKRRYYAALPEGNQEGPTAGIC